MKTPLNFTKDPQMENYIPFYVGLDSGIKTYKGIVLAGDIGGTKTHVCLYKVKDGMLWPLVNKNYLTNEYSSFEQVFEDFKGDGLPHINSMCLGVAGPVINGKVTGTNFPWAIEEDKLKKDYDISNVKLINDMEANSYGLAVLGKNDIVEIKKGLKIPGNAALISPGTGLGEAGLYWDGEAYHPFASEGGHCDFCVRNEFDVQFRQFLEKEYGHVSWERILSGPGIEKIYDFLIDHKNIAEPDWFTTKIQSEDKAAVISACAGEKSYDTCIETMDLFTQYLAIECAQMALKFKATGGIFIGGGILPRIVDQLDRELFTKHFLQMNRMNPLLEKIPIKIISNPNTAIYGAAYYATMHLKEE